MTASLASADFTVLIADDNRDLVESLAQWIQLELGCKVEFAYDGREAVDKAIAHRPDAMLLDISMPQLNGIDAATQVREAYPDNPPLMLVLTGKAGVADDLEAIDRRFDHAFAKPPDMQRLLAVLVDAASRRPPARRAPPSRFSVSELFTHAVREVLGAALAKGQTFAFDWRGALAVIEGDPAAFQAGLQRLMSAAVDMLESGFVIFSAEAQLQGDGNCRFVFTAAGTGPLCGNAKLAELLQRLQLSEAEPVTTARSGTRAGRGICPHTGGVIEFACHASEGVMFRCELRRPALEIVDAEIVDAAGARAWIVAAEGYDFGGLMRRLQRLGWAVTQLASLGDAVQRLTPVAGLSGRPELLVVAESSGGSALAEQVLRPLLHRSSRLVLAVLTGSPGLAAARAAPGLDVRVWPLSPGELVEITGHVRPDLPRGSGDTQPAPLSLGDRPVVLVVDDNEVNRIVAGGLVEALGFEVAMACDGLDAIEWCRHAPPQAVLMDLDMPVLRGLEATRRLRELQRWGVVPAFGIIACTANVDARTREECLEAGMDGYLSKPLNFNTLREELQRVVALR